MSEQTEKDVRPVRVTISLNRKSVARVDRLSALHEDNKTDTINRAIALYDMFQELQDDGTGLWTRESDGTFTQLRLLR